MATIHVDVVSAEESIFSGEAKFVALPGENGELGILPRHTPLITRIRPGAVRIERAYTKDKILELYLNEIYLGIGSYGVAAAGLNYFNKELQDLTIEEVAYLAALP